MANKGNVHQFKTMWEKDVEDFFKTLERLITGGCEDLIFIANTEGGEVEVGSISVNEISVSHIIGVLAKAQLYMSINELEGLV